ncbi:MAG: tyrosine-type recombinase/integrase [Synergistaceae bacterium]|nr:tyrosine-type recombinase/integrase [Synergistaceae bacterium]
MKRNVLTDTQVKNAKPREKGTRDKLVDGDGLYLELTPSGSKIWRYRYQAGGKDTTKVIGEYPSVSLSEARDLRDRIKKDLVHGVDLQNVLKPPEVFTFEKVAREFFTKQVEGKKAKSYSDTIIYRLERFLFPKIGQQVIDSITAPALLNLLRAIEATGNAETAHRVMQVAGRVFRYGISIGACMHDITGDLKGALMPTVKKHHAALTVEKDIAGLMRAINGFKGSFLVRCALLFSAHCFLRPGEVRHLEWSEVDFNARLIRIPAEKMKAKRPHIIPMSPQVVTILEQLHHLTGTGSYVFPSNRSLNHGHSPMSENTVSAALRRLGYSQDEMTAHGFRGMATTILYEHGWTSDAVERQLAHVVGSDVRQAYDYSQLLDKRRQMMEHYSNWLEGLNKFE